MLTIHLVVWFLCGSHDFTFSFRTQEWIIKYDLRDLHKSRDTLNINTARTPKQDEWMFRTVLKKFSEYAAYGFGDKSSLSLCPDYLTVYYLIVAKLKVDYVYYEALKNYQLSWRILKPNLSGRQHTAHPMEHTHKKLKNVSTDASDRWKSNVQGNGKICKDLSNWRRLSICMYTVWGVLNRLSD